MNDSEKKFSFDGYEKEEFEEISDEALEHLIEMYEKYGYGMDFVNDEKAKRVG